MVKAIPAMVRAALLEPAPVLELTEYLTVPLPAPLAPDVMLTHDAVLVVDQLQVPELVTVTLPVDALDVRDALVGDMA